MPLLQQTSLADYSHTHSPDIENTQSKTEKIECAHSKTKMSRLYEKSRYFRLRKSLTLGEKLIT